MELPSIILLEQLRTVDKRRLDKYIGHLRKEHIDGMNHALAVSIDLSDLYRQIFESRVSSMIRTEQSEQEYQETKKAIERLNADIAAQVRNLRDADEALRRFIQDDIKELTEELSKKEAALRRMEDSQSENQYVLHELNGMKKRLLSFEEYAKDAQPETVFTLIHTIVDRIYITAEGSSLKCQIYIKGCATDDYTDLFGAADYIDNNTVRSTSGTN